MKEVRKSKIESELNYLQKDLANLHLKANEVWKRTIHDPSFSSADDVCIIAERLDSLVSLTEDIIMGNIMVEAAHGRAG